MFDDNIILDAFLLTLFCYAVGNFAKVMGG